MSFRQYDYLRRRKEIMLCLLLFVFLFVYPQDLFLKLLTHFDRMRGVVWRRRRKNEFITD